MCFQKVTATSESTNCLGCKIENTAEKVAKEILNSILLCKWIMAQSLIAPSHPGFPLFLPDPSFNSVSEKTLVGCSRSSEGSVPIHLLPHVVLVMQAVHQMITSANGDILLYVAHLKTLCLVTPRFLKSVRPPEGHQPNDQEYL